LKQRTRRSDISWGKRFPSDMLRLSCAFVPAVHAVALSVFDVLNAITRAKQKLAQSCLCVR
jgi:hypothetical protein